MGINQNSSAIDVEEHDNTFGVKKMTPFLSDNNGNLVRQVSNGFQIGKYDYVSLVQDATTDAYAFKIGGSGGTLLATITITFTDSTKVTIDHVLLT